MKNFIAVFVFAPALVAQTLNIAETSGKGKYGVFVASNALVVKDFTTLPYSFADIYYGVTNRVDLYAGMSSATVFGQTQNNVFGGANVNVLKTKYVSVSNYTLVSTPINKHKDATGATVFTAAILSKTLGKTSRIIPYTGYSATIPVGNAQDKLFTAPTTIHNFPMGVMIPKGKLSYFVEYNFGAAVKTVSVGVSFTP
jgi:hypothetical protein